MASSSIAEEPQDFLDPLLVVGAGKPADVGPSAHQDGVEDVGGEGPGRALGDVGEVFGDLHPIHLRHLLSIDEDAALLRGDDPVDALDEGRLSGAVGPDYRHKPRRPDLKADVFEDRGAVVTKYYSLCLEAWILMSKTPSFSL